MVGVEGEDAICNLGAGRQGRKLAQGEERTKPGNGDEEDQ